MVADPNCWSTIKPKYGFASSYSKVGAVEGRLIVVSDKDLKKDKVCKRIFELGLKHIGVWKVGEKNDMQHYKKGETWVWDRSNMRSLEINFVKNTQLHLGGTSRTELHLYNQYSVSPSRRKLWRANKWDWIKWRRQENIKELQKWIGNMWRIVTKRRAEPKWIGNMWRIVAKRRAELKAVIEHHSSTAAFKEHWAKLGRKDSSIGSLH
ncbi:hypothetical protein QOT17_007526 [Balamuthia mandrillaris]